MSFALPLPNEWSKQGWKVKIRNDERNEEPHVTVLRRRWAWRLSLRTGEFLDRVPDPREVPGELVSHVWASRKKLRARWDERYPENPVCSTEGGE